MKEKKLHKGALKDAHAVSSRSVRSVISKYLVIGSTVLTFGCGAAAAPQLASLVNVPMADTKSKTIVIPDKEGPTKVEEKSKVEKKTEISIAELKAYQLKFKEKQGGYYELVSETDERFYVEVAFKKPIYLKEGKKALVVMARVSHKEEDLKQGGDKAGDIFLTLHDVKEGKRIAGWVIDFDKLRGECKEMTGKELKYVHVIVEHDGKGKDEYVQFYVIPANSKKAVEKGIIEAGMPIEVVQMAPNSENGKWESGTVGNLITASLKTGSEDEIVAKK